VGAGAGAADLFTLLKVVLSLVLICGLRRL
jgi:hypothetical protein